MKVEKPVRDIQTQLALKRIAESPRVSSRGLSADENLSVLKGDYIGRTRKLEKPPVQFRHPPIRDQDHVHFGQARQNARLLRRNLEAGLERGSREFFQNPNRDADCSLPVEQNDRGDNARLGIRLFRFH